MSGLGPNDVVASEPRKDGAAFDHTPTPGEGKPDVSEADEGKGKLAGKFDSPEELEKAYNELQAKFTKSRQGGADEGGQPTGEGEAPSGEPDGTIASARKAVEEAEEAGINMDALNAEWRENGELSDETYERLGKAGFDRGTVDGIIEGQKARAREAVRTMADVAGGEDALNEVLEWAAGNISESEANAYDNALASGDLDTATTIMRGIMAKRADAVGTTPGRTVKGEQAGQGDSTRPFASRRAMAEAMQDPRYRTDSEYREEVLRRAKVTP